jgi:hypothetical protein
MFYERVEGNYLFSAVNNPAVRSAVAYLLRQCREPGGWRTAKLPKQYQQLAFP